MVKLTAGLIVRSSSGYSTKFRNETVDHYLKRLTHVYLERKSLDDIVSNTVLLNFIKTYIKYFHFKHWYCYIEECNIRIIFCFSYHESNEAVVILIAASNF